MMCSSSNMTSIILWQLHGCRATRNDVRWVSWRLDRWDGMSSWRKDNRSSRSADGRRNWLRGIFTTFPTGVKIMLIKSTGGEHWDTWYMKNRWHAVHSCLYKVWINGREGDSGERQLIVESQIIKYCVGFLTTCKKASTITFPTIKQVKTVIKQVKLSHWITTLSSIRFNWMLN